jgi:hypothetical protein
MKETETTVILDQNGMPTTTSAGSSAGASRSTSFDHPTTKQERSDRESQPPELGRMVYVPKSVLPYIRCALDWVGVKVRYGRRTQSNKKGKCVGHVLDVRILKNGSAEMLVNCHDHGGHKPMWKHTRGLEDVLSETIN